MSKDFNIHIIAHQFIKHYYGMLAKNPSELHKFYMEDSCFMHSESLQEGVTVTGMENIRSAVSKLNLIGLSMDLSNGSVDAQPVANGGVLVVVTGHYTPAATQMTSDLVVTSKAFVQTFYLTAKSNQAYYVSNSVFRLLSIDEPQQDEPASISQPTVVPLATESTVPVLEVEVEVIEEISLPVVDEVVVETILHDSRTAIVESNPVVVEDSSIQEVHVAEDSSLNNNASKKLNYSDIVKKLAGVTSNKSAGSAAPPSTTASHHSHVQKQSQTSSTSLATKATSAASKATANVPVNSSGKPSFSIYIKQLPEKTTQADLNNLFSSFGPILNIDQVPGRAFAFVKFETNIAMKNAVAASTGSNELMLHGQVLKVEERNSARTAVVMNSTSNEIPSSSSVSAAATIPTVNTENGSATKHNSNQSGGSNNNGSAATGRHRDRGSSRGGGQHHNKVGDKVSGSGGGTGSHHPNTSNTNKGISEKGNHNNENHRGNNHKMQSSSSSSSVNNNENNTYKPLTSNNVNNGTANNKDNK